jgi:sugar/nucleoside kinase (ribokinase family)
MSKTFQVFGVGNALVDIEFRATELELQKLGFEKGGMTLASPEAQHSLLEQFQHHESHNSSGGSAANTIIAFAQFGGKGAYSSVLGNDAMGNFYAEEFLSMGIHLDAPQTSVLPTGSCVVLITPDSERTLVTTLGANTLYGPNNVNKDCIASSEWVYVEGYKLTDEQGFAAIEETVFWAKKHDTHVAVSCSDGFVVEHFSDQLRAILPSASLVFANQHEATLLTEESTAHEAFLSLCHKHPAVVVTDGTRGSYAQFFGSSAQIPAFPVDALDTTGAGDMYAGGFLYGVLNRMSVDQAGRLASYAAAQVVAQYGARLRTSHIEIRESALQG